MSRELDLLAKEFQKTPVTVIRKDVNLFQSNIQKETGPFIRTIEQESKRSKSTRVTIVAVIE